MAKARGLPQTFKLDVSAAAIGKPVELGDYLDDELPTLPVHRTEGSAAVAVAPVVEEPVARPKPQPAPPPSPSHPEPRIVEQRPMPSLAPRMPVERPARMKVSVPRKQVNMTPDTIAMVEHLLDFVQTYSVQKDLKASEMFHALVLALYEARECIDLSRVQPRGRWGTPTAAALPIALKNAFQKAVRDYYDSQNPQ